MPVTSSHERQRRGSTYIESLDGLGELHEAS